jgi:predicted metalloprotease
MRWRDGRRSSNVEDRRKVQMTRKTKSGGIGILLLALVALYFGVDPSILLQPGTNLSDVSEMGTQQYQPSAEENELADFVSVVLAETEDTWREIFTQAGQTYREPVLVLFTGAVESACGFAQSAIGPFYCPADSKVYIDLSFYRDLRERFGAPGDFAQAYVVAHEIGHHVQYLLGITGKVQAMRQRIPPTEYNKLSVRLELQADCLAGIWAHHVQRSRQILEAGDLEEAIGAAAAIGDDRLQRQARGYVTPDSFTHGSSKQRVAWFTRGFAEGTVGSCDTFSAKIL